MVSLVKVPRKAILHFRGNLMPVVPETRGPPDKHGHYKKRHALTSF